MANPGRDRYCCFGASGAGKSAGSFAVMGPRDGAFAARAARSVAAAGGGLIVNNGRKDSGIASMHGTTQLQASQRPGGATAQLSLDEWLDDQESERDMLIMRLRRIETNLVRHGRLKRETLPRRSR